MENDHWNIDDFEFTESINNLFSFKYWMKILWNTINVVIYWLPFIGLIYARVICFKKDYMDVSPFWILYQMIVPIIIEIIILSYIKL